MRQVLVRGTIARVDAWATSELEGGRESWMDQTLPGEVIEEARVGGRRHAYGACEVASFGIFSVLIFGEGWDNEVVGCWFMGLR